jgi:hypothetical protein
MPLWLTVCVVVSVVVLATGGMGYLMNRFNQR